MESTSRIWDEVTYLFQQLKYEISKPFVVLKQHYTNARYLPATFYSPIVSLKKIRKQEAEIWKVPNNKTIPGIALNLERQQKTIRQFEETYGEIPFPVNETETFSYYFKNQWFGYSDATVLYGMIRSCRPKRIIEVGSGYSSAVMLDTNRIFFENTIALTFIDPYANRLRSLLDSDDTSQCTIIEDEVQNVSVSVFSELREGDILFIDSSHIVKTGSDVLHLIFNVVPLLSKGVYIHFHDIFHPFEYPKDWVYQGRNWNELYFLRAFLTANSTCEIVFFSNYLQQMHPTLLHALPLCMKERGSSLWLQKK